MRRVRRPRGRDGGYETGMGVRLAIASRLVLNVVDDQAVRREQTKSIYLFGCDVTQSLRG